MGYRLRSGLSFCEIEGKAIFLDVAADRYFCLSDDSSAAFLDLVQDPSGGLDPALQSMVADSMLVPVPGGQAPVACAATTGATTMLTGSSPAASPADTLEALARRATAEVALKVAGLARQVENARRRPPGVRDSDGVALRASAAFAAASLWRSPRRRCLSISFATLAWLARRGCHAELLFGVRLHPFQAHCWVQYRGRLVNDPVDAVRNFTPILAL